MILRDFNLMVDENISPEVTTILRKEGFDVFSVEESEFVGSTDRQLIRLAYAAKRVILTHDSDFGMLAIRDGEPYFGIIHLRPGHVPPVHTITGLRRLLNEDLSLSTPFILICQTFPGFRVRIR